MNDIDSEWRLKGATLSHKTAQEEFRVVMGGNRPSHPGWQASLPGTIHARQSLVPASPARSGRVGEGTAWRQLREGPASQNGACKDKPRVEAAEKPDSGIGKTKIGADWVEQISFSHGFWKQSKL